MIRTSPSPASLAGSTHANISPDGASSAAIFQLTEQSEPILVSQIFLGHGYVAKGRHLHGLSTHPMSAEAASRQTDNVSAHTVFHKLMGLKRARRDIQLARRARRFLQEKLCKNNHVLKLSVLFLNEFFLSPKPSKCLNHIDLRRSAHLHQSARDWLAAANASETRLLLIFQWKAWQYGQCLQLPVTNNLS